MAAFLSRLKKKESALDCVLLHEPRIRLVCNARRNVYRSRPLCSQETTPLVCAVLRWSTHSTLLHGEQHQKHGLLSNATRRTLPPTDRALPPSCNMAGLLPASVRPVRSPSSKATVALGVVYTDRKAVKHLQTHLSRTFQQHDSINHPTGTRVKVGALAGISQPKKHVSVHTPFPHSQQRMCAHSVCLAASSHCA
jgi:hypothetical protein